MLDSAHAIKFRDLTRDAQALALEFERGQASTPLAEHCKALLDELYERPFTAAVVVQDAGARDAALAWLLGDTHRRVSVHIGRWNALLEIRLQDQGYGLETSSGRSLQFDSLEQLLQALGPGDPTADGGDCGAPLRISLATPAMAQGATLLVVDPTAAEGVSAGLASTLITRCQLLVTAGAGEPLPAVLDGWLQVAQGIGSVLPAQCGDVAVRAPWWRTLPASVTLLGPVTLDVRAASADVTVLPMPPSPLNGAMAGLQPHLLVSAQARRLQLAIDALRERQEQDLRRLQTQRQREEGAARADAPGADTALRRPFEQVRSTLQDELGALSKSVQESARRNLLPEGMLSRTLSEQLAGLRSEDLQRDNGPKAVKLSLSQDYQAHLQRTLRKALKAELTGDLSTLRDGLDAMKKDLEARLERALSAPVTLAVADASESEIWARVGELVNVEIRYRGEMPRRGFLQRLGEGRRMVFAVMMVFSLVASMAGFSWRGIGVLGIGFLLLFLGAVFYTYRSWRREDVGRVDGELERVREQLLQECRRVATEAQREKQQQLVEHLDQAKRTLTARLEDLQRDRLEAEANQQGQQRERARTRLRKLEQQLREQQAQGNRVNKLRQEVSALVADSARTLREAAAKVATARAVP